MQKPGFCSECDFAAGTRHGLGAKIVVDLMNE